MNIIFHIFGYIGSFFLSLLLLPQVRKVHKTKTVDGLSKNFLRFQIITCSFWIVYGIGFIIDSQYLDGGIILLSNLSILSFTGFLMFQYNKYSNKVVNKVNNKICASNSNSPKKIVCEQEIYHKK